MLLKLILVFCFNVAVPMFLPSTALNTDTDDTRFIVFSDDETYSPFCSELQNRSLTVTCRVMGNPQPTIEIHGENKYGNRLNFHSAFQGADEIAIGLYPLQYGESLTLHCQASNIVTSLTFSIGLTYTCKLFSHEWPSVCKIFAYCFGQYTSVLPTCIFSWHYSILSYY